MKRFVYFLLIIFVLSMTAEATAENAAAKKQFSAKENSTSLMLLNYSQAPYVGGLTLPGKRSNMVLADVDTIAYNTLFVGQRSAFLHAGSTTPICYDPISGTYLVVETTYSSTNMTGDFKIYLTTDKGVNWSMDSLDMVDGLLPTNPSIAVVNDGSVTSYEDLPLLLVTESWMEFGGDFRQSGVYTLDRTSDDLVVEYYEGPEENNPGGDYVFRAMKLKSVVTDEEAYVFGLTKLSVVENTVQYGAYGFFGWDMESTEPYYTSIPDVMTADKFKPVGVLNSSYNTDVQFDHDKSGNLYAAVNNMFDRQDSENFDRHVAISKSVDNGITWSEMNKISEAALTTFLAEHDHNIVYTRAPYGEDAFFVNGVDDYSYIYKVVHYLDGDSENALISMVEARYRDGAWALQIIAEVNALDMKLFEKRPDAVNGSTWDVHWTDAPLGHEVQAAKTADGESIVVKYIDYRDSAIVLDAPYTYYVYDSDFDTYDEFQTESVPCTDIFLTHRKLNEVEFSPVVNATNDLYFQKISRMPDVVESVNEVGLFIHRFPLNAKTIADYSPEIGAIPDAICQQMGEFFQLVDFCTLDADHSPTGEVGVETKIDYDFRIDNVYPNPATDNAEIVFVLDKSSNVTIDMFDLVGHKTNLRKGFETKGAHVFSVNTADYPTGSYIITMTVDGRRVAKSINIVK